MMPGWLQAILMVASPVMAGAAAWGAVTIKLEWHKEKIDSAHKRLDSHDEKIDELLRLIP